MHTCSEKGCDNNVFSGGYCKYHQFKRRMNGGDLHKRKSIPKESKKRKEERIYYSKQCKLLEKEIRDANNGRIYCFFSGLEITGQVTWHHLFGRTGDYYTDKEWLVPCINEHHLDYHFKPVEWLMQQSWYEGFLDRLKLRSEELYSKEINKKYKVARINPEINFENNDD